MNLADDPASDSPEALLRHLPEAIQPPKGVQQRIKQKLQAKMTAPMLLMQAREAIRPHTSVMQKVWSLMKGRVHAQPAVSLWDRLRSSLLPADADAQGTIWSHISLRLQPAYSRVLISRPVKIAAAFAVLFLVVRASPLVFLATPTVAEATATLLASSGNVSVLVGGLWQPVTGELTLQEGMQLQTGNGEATLLLYDDAVVRMGEQTMLTVQDLSDRPKVSTAGSSLSLQYGQVWILGFIPKSIEGLTISMPDGRLTVQEGSVSITYEQGTSVVQVWHRSAMVARRSSRLTLVAGEKVALQTGNVPAITRIESAEYDRPWVNDQLAMDAVHQREIAQWQQERRAAKAGILPDSTFYPAKRLAEAVDVLFTFGTEARAKKRINQANTRLNEAAALLSKGSGSDTVAAASALREFRETLLSVASASGSSTVDSLLEQEVISEAIADTSAALPDDNGYALKQAVRDTIAALPSVDGRPDTIVDALLDELTLVKRHAEEGELQTAKDEFEAIKSSLSSLDSSGSTLSSATLKEVEAAFSAVTAAVDPAEEEEPAEPADDEEDSTSSESIDRLSLRISNPSRRPSEQKPLSEEELMTVVQQIRNRVVQGYQSRQARQNQLQLEFRRLEGHPDQGRILRKLAHVFDENGLARLVRIEIVRVGAMVEETGTGECVGESC